MNNEFISWLGARQKLLSDMIEEKQNGSKNDRTISVHLNGRLIELQGIERQFKQMLTDRGLAPEIAPNQRGNSNEDNRF